MKIFNKFTNIKLTIILLNILLLLFLLQLSYSSSLIILIKDFVINICQPFFIGFLIAYILYPYIKYLSRKGIPNYLSIVIVYAIIIFLLGGLVYLLLPLLINQSSYFLHSLINNFELIYNKINTLLQLDPDFTFIIYQQAQTVLFNSSEYLLYTLFSFISLVGNGLMSLIFSIYFITSFPKIISYVKKVGQRNKLYNYIYHCHLKLTAYFSSMLALMIVKVIEYAIIFIIIGIKDWLVLALFTGIMVWFPYVGPVIANVVMIIAAFSLPSFSFIVFIILLFIASNLDQYVISPMFLIHVIKINPLFLFLIMFASSYLLGIIGIVISTPLCIVIQIYIQRKRIINYG